MPNKDVEFDLDDTWDEDREEAYKALRHLELDPKLVPFIDPIEVYMSELEYRLERSQQEVLHLDTAANTYLDEVNDYKERLQELLDDMAGEEL